MTETDHKQEVLSYYENTSLDYGEWSRNYNMHFGYYRFPMNPFVREPMLEEMNRQVFTHLHLQTEDSVPRQKNNRDNYSAMAGSKSQ